MKRPAPDRQGGREEEARVVGEHGDGHGSVLDRDHVVIDGHRATDVGLTVMSTVAALDTAPARSM